MNGSNRIRLQEFCQFKNKVRGSTDYLIVGLDIAKERHNAFFGTATGRTLHKGMFFDNTYDGFQKLLIQTDALKVQHGLRKVIFGLEPTANYHKPLGEYLIKGGHMVVLVSAAATAKNRELLDGRWDKHATKDSANVADLIAQGKCLYYDCPGEDLRSLRGLLSLKRRLKKEEHGLQVRIRNQLRPSTFQRWTSTSGDPRFRSGCISQGPCGNWQRRAVYKWQAGIEDVRVRSVCRPER